MHCWLAFLPQPGVYYCKITCKKSEVKISKKLKIDQRQLSLLKLNTAEVSSIKRSEFETKEMIGSGSQGKVYRGSFGDIEVAVKVIKLYTTNTEHISQEAKILKRVENINFIGLYGVCMEKKQVSLIMEYFKSVALCDLIHGEDDIKSTYSFNVIRKTTIAL